jgi:phosphohistidine phosphatase
MELILWRHAEAADPQIDQDDLERQLTAKGHKQARKMADWLNLYLPDHCKILVSPAVRTLQTVEPLGRKFKIEPNIAPGASGEDILEAAGWPDGDGLVLVVGHQPSLGQAASLVMAEEDLDWNMKKGSTWWFAQGDDEEPLSLYLKAVTHADLLLK